MTLVKCNQKQYDPFRELFDLHHPMTALSFFPNLGKLAKESDSAAFFPAMDISEDKDNILIKVDLPGIKKEDVVVDLNDQVLTIKGERKSESETKDKNVHRVERIFGSFERSLSLGVKVDESKIKAVYKDGVLDITIPKLEKAPQKRIAVD